MVEQQALMEGAAAGMTVAEASMIADGAFERAVRSLVEALTSQVGRVRGTQKIQKEMCRVREQSGRERNRAGQIFRFLYPLPAPRRSSSRPPRARSSGPSRASAACSR